MKKNFSGINVKLKTATKDLDQKSDEANLEQWKPMTRCEISKKV